MRERSTKSNHKDTKEAQSAQRKNNLILENDIANKVIGVSIGVHRVFGPGLLESAYKECLYHKLNKDGFRVEKEKVLPIVFENTKLDCGYRIDILVENRLVIELKAVEELSDVHIAQVLTYLKLGKFKLGLLINFNVSLLKKGIKRIIN